MSDPYGSITLTTTERQDMETYTITGTFTFMVDASNLDEAVQQLAADMEEIMYDWNIEQTYGGK